MPRVYVAGEALIDLITVGGSSSAHVGGGPANTAKALARLGLASYFVGGISSDEYGSLIEAELLDSGVDLSLALRGDKPTALARAFVDENGVASYEFELEGTTTFDFSSTWLPSGEVDVVHVGTLATLVEPGASELFSWVSELGAPVVFDPNVRPSVLGDKDSYRAVVEKWIQISNLVKLSEDDLNWLYGETEAEVLARWLASGTDLVVVTRGARGVSGYTKDLELHVPGVAIELVDTVGAGDTIGAVLVEGLLKYGQQGLIGNLEAVLNRAVKAAGITCSRAGANPPWAAELD